MRVLLFVFMLCACAESSARQYYIANGTCDGWPRVPIEMPPGYCAGLVLGPTEGAFAQRTIRMPRVLLPIDPSTWLVTDLGGWNAGTGAVWRLSISTDRKPTMTKLLGGLAMPHTIAIGPERAIYVGEMSRIFRFDPSAADPSTTIVAVVTGLPDNRLHKNRHPLSHFIFDGNGDLIVNVGARPTSARRRRDNRARRAAPTSRASAPRKEQWSEWDFCASTSCRTRTRDELDPRRMRPRGSPPPPGPPRTPPPNPGGRSRTSRERAALQIPAATSACASRDRKQDREVSDGDRDRRNDRVQRTRPRPVA